MLAQNFKSKEELKIEGKELSALISVLHMLEREELKHGDIKSFLKKKGDVFNMAAFKYVADCGTIGCIAGWADVIGGTDLVTKCCRHDLPNNLQKLFVPCLTAKLGPNYLREISAPQAAVALRSYLTTGHPNWDEALAS
jgi:hypothetical protein